MFDTTRHTLDERCAHHLEKRPVHLTTVARMNWTELLRVISFFFVCKKNKQSPPLTRKSYGNGFQRVTAALALSTAAQHYMFCTTTHFDSIQFYAIFLSYTTHIAIVILLYFVNITLAQNVALQIIVYTCLYMKCINSYLLSRGTWHYLKINTTLNILYFCFNNNHNNIVML